MCNLGIQKYFSQQMTSEAHKALKKKNDLRAFALLKAIAATQIVPSSDLSQYPTLAKYLKK